MTQSHSYPSFTLVNTSIYLSISSHVTYFFCLIVCVCVHSLQNGNQQKEKKKKKKIFASVSLMKRPQSSLTKQTNQIKPKTSPSSTYWYEFMGCIYGATTP